MTPHINTSRMNRIKPATFLSHGTLIADCCSCLPGKPSFTPTTTGRNTYTKKERTCPKNPSCSGRNQSERTFLTVTDAKKFSIWGNNPYLGPCPASTHSCRPTLYVCLVLQNRQVGLSHSANNRLTATPPNSTRDSSKMPPPASLTCAVLL